MTTYNTGNPLGSTSPKDLFDNAENLDGAINDTTATIWVDRLGKSRKTWKGLEDDVYSSVSTAVDQALGEAESMLDAAVSDATQQAESYRDQAASSATTAGNEANIAQGWAEDARAAAEATGDVIFFDSYADANAALPDIPEGGVVEIFQDENNDGARTRYIKEGGALVFKINLDYLEQLLANRTNPSLGAEMIGSRGVTAAAIFRSTPIPKNYGINGDGSDETAAINAYLADMASIGYPARFERGALYRGSGLVIPAGAMLDGYGAEFVSGTTGSEDIAFSILEGAEVQDFKLMAVNGQIGSGRIYPGAVVRNSKFIADAEMEGTIFIHPSASLVDLEAYNLERPFYVVNWDDTYASGTGLKANFKLRNYVRGVRLDAVDDADISLDVGGRAAAAALEPGNNGILINGCKNVRFRHSRIFDSGEHAVRIGGDVDNRETENLHFEHLRIDNAWGCAFKINPDVGLSGRGIIVDVLDGSRIGNGTSGRNSELIRTSGADGVHFGYVRHRNMDSSRQLICAVQTGRTNNLSIDYIDVDGCGEFVRFNDDMDGPGPVDGFHIGGGRVVSNSIAAIQLNMSTHGVGNVDIKADVSGNYSYYAQGHSSGTTNITGPIRFDISVLSGGSTLHRFFLDTDDVTSRVWVADTGNIYEGQIAQRQAAARAIAVPALNPANIAQTDRSLLLKSTGGTAAQGAYGPALELSRVSSGRRGGGVGSKQTGANVNQTGLAFFVGATNEMSEELFEGWVIDHNRAFYPALDNAFSAGTASNRISQIFAGTANINTSDGRDKSEVRKFTDQEISAALELADEIGIYQWLESIDEKGIDAARLHSGLTVQRAIEVMESHGLVPIRYGWICHDEWDAITEIKETIAARDAVVDEAGNEIEPALPEHEAIICPAREAGDRWSFRPTEMIFWVIAAMAADRRARQLEIADIKTRLAALEGATT